jgi:hypothetical protein
MTIYYIYVKTHNVTGLKYLGYTKQKDPHKYTGSGVRWLKHLKKHGFDYKTEILKECSSKAEVREHGIYYSKLWDIVKDKGWANLIEEQGDGGSCCGKLNGMFGKKRTPKECAAMGIRATKQFKGKSYEELYGKEKSDELKKERSISSKRKDNSYRNNARFDPTEYTFMNIYSGEIIHCTRWVLIHYYELNKGGVCDMINQRMDFNFLIT